MSGDPWKHRSSGMQCRTCMWFVAKVEGAALANQRSVVDLDQMEPGEVRVVKSLDEAPAVQPMRRIGRCRRHAPTMNGYPVVFSDDWCGDHKLDENNL